MDIQSLIRRDDTSFDVFLNKAVLELLGKDTEQTRPGKIAQLIVDNIQVQTMLTNQKMRNVLIRSMKKSEAEEFAKAIGIQEWKNLQYKLTTMDFKKKRLEKALKFFNKKYDEEPKNIRIDIENIYPKRFLFDHQIKTVKKVQDLLSKHPHKALLHMPTGSGKTLSSMRIVLTYLLSDPSSLIIWLAHNEELCEQAMQEFQNMWKAAGDREIETYRFFGKTKINPLKITEGFMVAGLQKMLAAARNNNTLLSEVAKNTTLVVIDEAHMAIADKFSIVIEELASNKSTRLLGLSATPGRTSDSRDMGTKKLARFFGNNKVLLDTGKKNPITFLIKEGYLARPEFKHIDGGKRLSEQDLVKISNNEDVPKNILEKLSDDAIRNYNIIKEIIEFADNNNKIIVFAASISHAQTIALLLSSKKYNSNIPHEAHYVTHKTSLGMRAKILDDYKNTSKPMILCNFGILTTGFDAPKTSAIVIARPTKSYVLYAQMIGRGIRGPKAGGNKTCQISTVIDKGIQEFISIEKIFSKWDKSWDD